MNIIFIIIDTLRYDYIRANGLKPWMHTPNMDRLAARSLVFDRAYAASFPTIPHRTDLMTGQYGDPFHRWLPLRTDIETLPRLLERQGGYCTQLLHSTPHLVNGLHGFDFPFNAWTPVRGTEVDRPWIDDKPFTYLSNWTNDPLFDFVTEPVFSKALGQVMVTYSRANRQREKLEDWSTSQLFALASRFLKDNQKRRNFFLWLDCFDPHPPYDAPAELVRLYDQTPGYDGKVDMRGSLLAMQFANLIPSAPQAAIDRVRAYYAAMVTFVDQGIGRLLDTLEETGLDKETAIVFTADHGTKMGEFHSMNKNLPFTDHVCRVPLMVATPDGAVGHSSIIVQPQDIFQLILGLGKVPPPAGRVGHDPLQAALSGAAWPREVGLTGISLNYWKGNADQSLVAVHKGDWYLTLAANPAACQLFHLGATRLEENQAAARPEMVNDLRAAGIAELKHRGLAEPLVEWLQTHGQLPFPQEAVNVRQPSPGWEEYWGRIYNRWE
jgi:arylsulfatase A-like enzyme